MTSWSTRIIKERAAEVLLQPLSPITAEGSQDSIMVQIKSSSDETPTPAGLCQTRSTHQRRPRRPLKREFQQEKPGPAEDFLFKNILRAPAMGVPRQPTEIKTGRGYHGGAWPERDRSCMNALRPHFGSWAQVVPFVRPHIARRTTLHRLCLWLVREIENRRRRSRSELVLPPSRVRYTYTMMRDNYGDYQKSSLMFQNNIRKWLIHTGNMAQHQ